MGISCVCGTPFEVTDKEGKLIGFGLIVRSHSNVIIIECGCIRSELVQFHGPTHLIIQDGRLLSQRLSRQMQQQSKITDFRRTK